MPRDSQGNFSNVYNWEQDAANGIGIEPDRHQEGDDDQAQGLTDSLDRKGRGGMQAALAMGNFKITQLDTGTAATDAATLTQIQAGAFGYAGTDTGAANAYVISLSPAPTAYTAGLRVVFKAANANTGASTLQVGGLTPAPAIEWHGSALTGGEITTTGLTECEYDGTAWQILSNVETLPADKGGTGGVLPIANGGTAATTAPDARTNLGLGTAATEDTGTAIGDVVQLEDVTGSAGLPAVDGSQLLNLPGGGANSRIRTEVFTTSGTWNKSTIGDATGIYVEARGGGGAGGGAANPSSNGNRSVGGGGGQGGRSIVSIAAASLGATETVTVGTGGTGVAGGTGGAGSASSFGTFCTANGGLGAGSSGDVADTSTAIVIGGDAGTAATGDLNITGTPGGWGLGVGDSLVGGQGGGEGGGRPVPGGNRDGVVGTSGGGGSGAINDSPNAARPGGNGGDGYVIVYWVETTAA